MTASAGGERSTFVVTDSLAAQQWEMHLAATEIGRGAAAWATPALATYAAWLDGFWRAHCGDRGEPLTVGQSAALWRRVLAESRESAELIGQAGAAEWAADGWHLLHRWRLDPAAQRPYSDQLDYRAFLSWCRSYGERLEGHGWVDRAVLEATLAARALGGAASVVAADLGEPYPSRAALFAQVEAHGGTVTATTAPFVGARQRAARLGYGSPRSAATTLAAPPSARAASVASSTALSTQP